MTGQGLLVSCGLTWSKLRDARIIDYEGAERRLTTRIDLFPEEAFDPHELLELVHEFYKGRIRSLTRIRQTTINRLTAYLNAIQKQPETDNA